MQDRWDPGLCSTKTFGIHAVYIVLPAPIPHTPTPNHSSPHSELKSHRKPEPLVLVQWLALVLSGSAAALMVRSLANMYSTGIMKIEKLQVSEKHILPPHQRAHWFCHDQSGAKRVKRGQKIKSILRSCVKQVPYGPSEADHETSPECKYYLLYLANVRNLSEYILQVRNSSPFPLLHFLCPWTLYPLKSQVTIHINKVLRCLTKKIGSADFST